MVFATKWSLLARPLTGRPDLWQGGRASYRKAGHLIGRPGLSQGGQASNIEARPLQRGPASWREAKPLTGRLGLLHWGWALYREAGPLTGRPGLSQWGQASHRVIHNSQKLIIKKYFHKILKYELHIKCDILDFEKKIRLAWERCSCFPALSDGVVLAKWRVSKK